jgi:hypothetical protein
VEKRVSPAAFRHSHRILARLLPDAQAEALVGDLIEEYQLRLRGAAPHAAARWYWKQVAASVPSLIWASARRGSWLTTVATAVASYVAVGVLEFVLTAVVTAMPASMFLQTLLALLAGVAALVVGGYVAGSIRPEAARLLALLVLVPTARPSGISARFSCSVHFLRWLARSCRPRARPPCKPRARPPCQQSGTGLAICAGGPYIMETLLFILW